jgi:GxxExxY protein
VELTVCSDELIEKVIGAAIEVHRVLGPGLLESVYERALMIELADRGIAARNQVEVPASYKGRDLGIGFRADIIVEESLIVELKACSNIEPIHMAQTMSYQKQLRFKRGLLINFNCRLLKDSIKRLSI